MEEEEEEEVDTIQNLHNSSGTGSEEEGGEGSLGEENALIKFMDSIDAYLILMNSLSSTLRQGWMELACARHSMGASRVNTALFDLKDHSASTTLTLQLRHDIQGRVANGGSPGFANDQAHKERFKMLSMFGRLVSPKLRSAQISFETALETLAELANT